MKASSKALAALSALMLLHLLICSPSSLPLERTSLRGCNLPRRLLLSVVSSASTSLKNLPAARMKEPKKAVEASLRKAPPSVPNPTQNK
ncbi:hypothetical protein AAC387_Pa02g4785 [Persea americana]